MTKFDLNKTLKRAGWTEDDIKSIYHGGDHVCRCGCAGRYFERGTPGFTRALNKLRRGFMTETKGERVFVTGYGHNEFQTSDGVHVDPHDASYINIPEYDAPSHNRCYCIYKD